MLCKPPLASLLFNGGYHRAQLRRHAKDSALILMYHRVRGHSTPGSNGDRHAGFDRGVSLDHFARQMRFVCREMTPLAMTDLIEKLKNGMPLPPRAVAVTFDDGYRDTYDLAFPVLRQYGIPATVFVATAFIDSPDMFWWDAVAEMVRQTSSRSLDLRSIVADGALPLETRQDRMRATETLIEKLRTLSPARITAALTALGTALRVGDPWRAEAHLMLTWDQVREMSGTGISIESHTRTHPNLALLDSAEVEDELRRSRTLIEEKTGRPAHGLAYPWGTAETYTAETARIAARCGYHYACAVGTGSVRSGSDPFALPRLPVGDLPPASMCLDVLQAYRQA